MITWEYHDYDYIHSECNRLHCEVIMITMYITQTWKWFFINIHSVTCIIPISTWYSVYVLLSGIFLKWKCTRDFDGIAQC